MKRWGEGRGGGRRNDCEEDERRRREEEWRTQNEKGWKQRKRSTFHPSFPFKFLFSFSIILLFPPPFPSITSSSMNLFIIPFYPILSPHPPLSLPNHLHHSSHLSSLLLHYSFIHPSEVWSFLQHLRLCPWTSLHPVLHPSIIPPTSLRAAVTPQSPPCTHPCLTLDL